MEGILEICMFAVVRMTAINARCKTAFVHQNVTGIDVKAKTRDLRVKINKHLEKVKKLVVEQEGVNKEDINECLNLDSEKLAYYLPNYKTSGTPKAVYQDEYTKHIADLKRDVLTEMKGSGISFAEVGGRFERVWNALMKENFIFSFKNAIDLQVNRGIEKEYHKLLNRFKKKLIEVTNQVKKEIREKEDDFQLADMVKELLGDTIPLLKKEFDEYFDDEPHADIKRDSKATYLRRLTHEMETIPLDQIRRLHECRNVNKFEKVLRNNDQQFEKRFLEECNKIAKKIVEATQKGKEEHFEELFETLKKNYLDESELAISQYRDQPIKNLLEKQLHELYKSVADHTKIFEKYANTKDGSLKQTPFQFDDQHHCKGWLNTLRKRDMKSLKAKYDFSEETFLAELEYVIKTEISVYFETEEFRECGVCELTTDTMVTNIHTTIGNQSDGQPVTECFKRDYAVYMCFEVFLRELIDIKSEINKKFDPEEKINTMKPMLHEVFSNFCDRRSQVSTFFNAFEQALNTSLQSSLIKTKRKEVDLKIEAKFGGMNKEDLINHILLKAAQDEHDACFRKTLNFLENPIEFVRSYILQDAEEIADSESEKWNKEWKSFVDAAETALEKSKLDESEKADVKYSNWIAQISSYLEGKSIVLQDDNLRIFLDFDIDKKAFNQKIKEIADKLKDRSTVLPEDIKTNTLKSIVEQMTKSKIGCTSKCPICGAICDSTDSRHVTNHYSSNHSNICLKHKIVGRNGQLLSLPCANAIALNESKKIFFLDEDLQDFQKWNFKKGIKVKSFWIWFVATYAEQLKNKNEGYALDLDNDFFRTNPTKEAALASLKKPYTFEADPFKSKNHYERITSYCSIQ
ncbi:Up-regulator of cell proliferation [Cichlidogyrus casuarinus]|uniref:Up-regulator of cell proliferation n=1 Tax=Cichlidogyrus casuarinus TaxID=1844966 RepID=A0ABD2PQ70_9PLAT